MKFFVPLLLTVAVALQSAQGLSEIEVDASVVVTATSSEGGSESTGVSVGDNWSASGEWSSSGSGNGMGEAGIVSAGISTTSTSLWASAAVGITAALALV